MINDFFCCLRFSLKEKIDKLYCNLEEKIEYRFFLLDENDETWEEKLKERNKKIYQM